MGLAGDIWCRIEGVAGRITLNRPQALNALTAGMIAAMQDALDRWAGDGAVRLVLIEGAGGRGLCAGADIRWLRDRVLAGAFDVTDAFFAAEYRLNATIAAYPKPYVAFMDGITMGGGIGVSAHGSHRLVSERSVLAMPEVGIGLFADVGATWLLARAVGQLGLHVALTGDRFGAGDAIVLGLADRCIALDGWPDVAEALAAGAPLSATVEAVAVAAPDAPLAAARVWIDAAYAAGSVEAILAGLDASGAPAAATAARLIGTRCPTMLKVSLAAIRRAGAELLTQALAREYWMVCRAVRAADFAEGVRAAVIDKDRRPRWRPDRLEGVSAEDVAWFVEC